MKRSTNTAKKRRVGTSVTVLVIVVAAAAFFGMRRHTAQNDAVQSIPPGTPVLSVVEGQQNSSYPYNPATIHIPVGKVVAIKLTDNLGGCGLNTVFPNLKPGGGDATATVPVGQTKYIEIEAQKPGKYTFHCSSNMYFGTIVAG